MDNVEKLHAHLTKTIPFAICDDCLAEATSVRPRQQVNVIARALGLTTDFDRREGSCSVCGDEKLVTKALRYANRT